MKSIKYIMAGLIAAGIAASSYATVSVGWNTGGNTFFTDNTGAANYLSGCLLEIGTFTNTPSLANLVNGSFAVFGSTLTGTGGNAGVINSGNSSSGTAGAVFTHAQIYLVAFNAATAGAATQWGIFDVTDTINTNWKFPGDADVVASTAIDAQDMANGGTGTAAPGSQVVFGGRGTDNSGPFSLLETAPVPEPSSYALVGMGLLGAIGLIRRRK